MGADEFGTTLTETVIALPVLLLVFVGIVRLNSLLQPMSQVEAVAHKMAFKNAIEVQNEKLIEGGDISTRMIKHSVPTIAGFDAVNQLRTAPPRQKGAVGDLLALQETATYTFDGLALSGHFGESSSRLWLLDQVGVKFNGLGTSLDDTSRHLVGQSQYAIRVIDDGPNATFNAGTYKSKAGPVGRAFDAIPGLNTLFGARGALAAGIRYGTESGRYERNETIQGIPMEYHAWYTMTMPSYTSGEPYKDALRAMTVGRMLMLEIPHYDHAFGFNGGFGAGERRVDATAYHGFEAPAPSNIGFWGALNYDQGNLR